MARYSVKASSWRSFRMYPVIIEFHVMGLFSFFAFSKRFTAFSSSPFLAYAMIIVTGFFSGMPKKIDSAFSIFLKFTNPPINSFMLPKARPDTLLQTVWASSMDSYLLYKQTKAPQTECSRSSPDLITSP
ncbi:receptor homology region transmembrane domain ring H2 motif protein 1 [Striga asiatica]|uniref:Receptor homology region transmembrane domain ring H2 motif protein 1 n=1 Tax=Striga asiatica TaxID=4170 RepID=A0A5A7QXH8_STRAF|nr:receptor homology region transmembrane domain ring H2 motif protein 1 [Striga asiatica]